MIERNMALNLGYKHSIDLVCLMLRHAMEGGRGTLRDKATVLIVAAAAILAQECGPAARAASTRRRGRGDRAAGGADALSTCLMDTGTIVPVLATLSNRQLTTDSRHIARPPETTMPAARLTTAPAAITCPIFLWVPMMTW
jgi:hypothetical protein